MSQALQGKTEAFTSGSIAPANVWNGIPMEADGSLAIENGAVIDHYSQGLPMTAAGRLVVAIDGAVDHFGAGASPFDVSDRLCVTVGGIAYGLLAGNAYAEGEQLILGDYDPIRTLLGQGTIWFDETSIVGDVTGWYNLGAGGQVFNLDVLVGIPGNLTRTPVNGLDAVLAAGGVNLRSTYLASIPQPFTTFLVAKVTDAALPQISTFFDTFNATRAYNRANVTGGRYSAFTGFLLDTPSTVQDTEPRLHTTIFDGANGSYTVGGFDSIQGDIGPGALNFGTLFAAFNNSQQSRMLIAEFLVFDRLLTTAQIDDITAFLENKWL